MVLAFDLERKRIVLGCAAFLLGGFSRLVADDVAERDRLAQRVDQQIELGFERLVVEGDMAFVKTDRPDVHHPVGRLRVRVFRVELERPVRPPIGQTLQLRIGLGQVNARDGHALRQQGQW
ncbi:hypothetical protein D3C73_773910 [compost metagenome]